MKPAATQQQTLVKVSPKEPLSPVSAALDEVSVEVCTQVIKGQLMGRECGRCNQMQSGGTLACRWLAVWYWTSHGTSLGPPFSQVWEGDVTFSHRVTVGICWDEVYQCEGLAHWECSMKVAGGFFCTPPTHTWEVQHYWNITSKTVVKRVMNQTLRIQGQSSAVLVSWGRENDGLLSAASQTKYLAFAVWRGGFSWTWVLVTMIKGALMCLWRWRLQCQNSLFLSLPLPY